MAGRILLTSANTSDAYPFLRAASAGLRHHARTQAQAGPTDRLQADLLHAHLTALHQLLDQLAETTRQPHPAAGRHLATARTRLWQASDAVHDAFHLLPPSSGTDAHCRPEHLSTGPPVLTICQRHLASGHAVRRKTTPADLHAPLHGHTTTCAQ
ncbi:hypothetical protein ADK70_31870 [Streptomyces rimosus subsp. pseudoverticillatus]|nr:hypothetical protein ADK70_31870 [Streptomyces rimosus subsp. pseudoverticillatus]